MGRISKVDINHIATGFNVNLNPFGCYKCIFSQSKDFKIFSGSMSPEPYREAWTHGKVFMTISGLGTPWQNQKSAPMFGILLNQVLSYRGHRNSLRRGRPKV